LRCNVESARSGLDSTYNYHPPVGAQVVPTYAKRQNRQWRALSLSKGRVKSRRSGSSIDNLSEIPDTPRVRDFVPGIALSGCSSLAPLAPREPDLRSSPSWCTGTPRKAGPRYTTHNWLLKRPKSTLQFGL
jgi:hypothetical protein